MRPRLAPLSVLLLAALPLAGADVPIHGDQGPGASSPLIGQAVTTTGIVTVLRTNGFHLQAPDAEVDADPGTSEGVFVFTSSAPSSAAAVGNRVRVSGSVVEYRLASDPASPPLVLTARRSGALSRGAPCRRSGTAYRRWRRGVPSRRGRRGSSRARHGCRSS